MRIRITQSLNTHNDGYLKFEKRWVEMFGFKATGRVKKKLKSIWHYVVNKDTDTAWKFYRQLEKEIKVLHPEYE